MAINRAIELQLDNLPHELIIETIGRCTTVAEIAALKQTSKKLHRLVDETLRNPEHLMRLFISLSPIEIQQLILTHFSHLSDNYQAIEKIYFNNLKQQQISLATQVCYAFIGRDISLLDLGTLRLVINELAPGTIDAIDKTQAEELKTIIFTAKDIDKNKLEPIKNSLTLMYYAAQLTLTHCEKAHKDEPDLDKIKDVVFLRKQLQDKINACCNHINNFSRHKTLVTQVTTSYLNFSGAYLAEIDFLDLRNLSGANFFNADLQQTKFYFNNLCLTNFHPDGEVSDKIDP